MVTLVGYDESVAKTITCRKCGAINKYTPNDVRTLHRGTDYGGGSDGADGFNCAGCGKEIYTKSW